MGQGADALERAARELRMALGPATGRVALSAVRDRATFDAALDSLGTVLAQLAALLRAHEERAEEIRNCRLRCDELAARAAQWRCGDERPREDVEDDEALVRWIEAYPQSAVLYMTPLDVGRIFRAQVEEAKRAWIFTSATLSVNLEAAATRSWPSPYDFASQGLLYVPEGLPDPNTEGYAEAVIDAAWPVVCAAEGHAFLLFTSLRAMDRGFERLSRKVAAAGLSWPLMLQGTGSKNELLERFRRSPHAVLVGSQSFWEGVDVKGEQLSLVVIDRLPFNPPDDPVLAACIERIQRSGGNAFMQYQLPRAVIALKQGVGRLIRDEADRGALMICDPRLISKAYGKTIWRALPPFRRTRALADVEAFFGERRRAADEPALSATAEPAGTSSPRGSS